MNEDLWWSDELDIDGKVLKLAKKCHITLVDFGFARALSPKDIKDDVGLKKIVNESETPIGLEAKTGKGKMFDVSCINHALLDTSHSEHTRGRGRSRYIEMDTSISHKPVRDLSKLCFDLPCYSHIACCLMAYHRAICCYTVGALGTRNYAAPEILSGIRNFADAMSSSIHSTNGSSHRRRKKGTCVSDYGMVSELISTLLYDEALIFLS